MKNKANYLFIFVAIHLLLLGSCSPAHLSTPTQSPTATATFAPTNTPTTTPSPTETPDPNKPADATGHDTNGYYKEVQENGKTIRYYWADLKREYGLDINIKGWFTSHILKGSLHGGIPLLEPGGVVFSQMLPLFVDFQEGVNGYYLQHTDRADDPYSPSFTKILFTDLENRYFGRSFINVPRDDLTAYNLNFRDGKITIPFTTSTGNYIWKLTQSTGYKFYAINWDDADPALHAEFLESKDKLKRENLVFRWMSFTGADGTLIAISAVEEPEKLSDEEYLSWILNPLIAILENEQLSPESIYWSSTFNSLVQSGFASGSTNITVDGTPMVVEVLPHFEIIHNP